LIFVGICLVSLSFSVRFSKISGVFCFCLCIFPCSFPCYICSSVFMFLGFFPFWLCVFVTVFVTVCLFLLFLSGSVCFFCFFFVCLCLFCFFSVCFCFFLSVNQPFSRCLCLSWSRQTQSSKVIVRWSAILKFTQKTFQVWIYKV
jgi:hypothetical protein